MGDLDEQEETGSSWREIGCQTEPNLIDKLLDSSNSRKQRLEDVDLYQEYVRSAQCAQFWPLDKNPIRTLVPAMIKVDLPEQHLKNESLMFDLVQAISNNSKLVNLLAKYIHHIVPNVIISKRIDLIPLITCTIRVCREQAEQERLVGLLFNLIKRPNEEQRRMILSGLIVVLQVSPSQNCDMLLPNLWDHICDKFPERRILLAESCASLANYVRPALRTNLILSILIQLLKDKHAGVRAAACKSFACLLTLIMDTNDEVFDACLAAAEELIQDVLQQTPMSFCEHRFELEEMRYCALETIYPLICMWSVKLNRFKHDLADFYLAKADKYLTNLASHGGSSHEFSFRLGGASSNASNEPKVVAAAEVARRRSIFLETRHKRQSGSTDSGLSGSLGTPPPPPAPPSSSLASPAHRPSLASNLFAAARRPSAFVTGASSKPVQIDNQAIVTAQKAVCAYLKMATYLVSFVFADTVQSCAWLSKPVAPVAPLVPAQPSGSFMNKLLDPSLILEDSAIVAFHEQMHLVESHDWMLDKFLPGFLKIIGTFSEPRLQLMLGLTNSSPSNSSQVPSNQHATASQATPAQSSSCLNHSALLTDLLTHCLGSIRNLCVLFGRPLTKSKIRPIIKGYAKQQHIYLAALTAFEPIEQREFEEVVSTIGDALATLESLSRVDVEMLAISIRIIATSQDQIQSPSTRQKFLTYTLDALVRHSIKFINSSPAPPNCNSNSSNGNDLNNNNHSTTTATSNPSKTKPKEYMLIIFRHILTCLIDPSHRPADWAQILVTKFLPTLIALANDSTDVYICTYARLMCAKLVETFDLHFNNPKLTKEQAQATLPALESLRALTDQIRASNLNRQIEFLLQEYKEKF